MRDFIEDWGGILVLFIFMFLIVGGSVYGLACLVTPSQAEREHNALVVEQDKRSAENCLKVGGIVTRSAWSGLVDGCVVIPKEH